MVPIATMAIRITVSFPRNRFQRAGLRLTRPTKMSSDIKIRDVEKTHQSEVPGAK
jgi:hypothetical protein